MNEQIKALAQQAGESIPEFHFGDWNIPNEFIQKFAQLIVRECCDWIDGSPATDAGQLLLTKSFITANLKGHFGVE